MSSIWQAALERLGEVKRVVIVGYSMPSTDIYMQYFLKTSLGPNTYLDRITIYNPILFEDDHRVTAMRDRYSSCFSENLRKRIEFRPKFSKLNVGEFEAGKLSHFVGNLFDEDNVIFFP